MRIRIQEGNSDPQKKKKVMFHVLKCWMFSLRAEGIAWTSFPAVFRIRIHMFLGLPDPDPFVRGMDPDPYPSVIMQK
jgi:hypothetical protein